MKYLIEIDDRTSIGKYLVGLIKSLLKKEEGIELLSEAEVERREDMLLSKMIKHGVESGIADKNEVLKKLDLR